MSSVIDFVEKDTINREGILSRYLRHAKVLRYVWLLPWHIDITHDRVVIGSRINCAVNFRKVKNSSGLSDVSQTQSE